MAYDTDPEDEIISVDTADIAEQLKEVIGAISDVTIELKRMNGRFDDLVNILTDIKDQKT